MEEKKQFSYFLVFCGRRGRLRLREGLVGRRVAAKSFFDLQLLFLTVVVGKASAIFLFLSVGPQEEKKPPRISYVHVQFSYIKTS